jgi:hypothetical protein
MTDFSIDKFKHGFGGVARPNLFRVTLAFPNEPPSEKYTIYCKGASVPTKRIASIQLHYMGRAIKYAGDTSYETWSVTIYNDIGFTIRKKLERWAEIINGARDNISALFKSEYETEMLVEQMNGKKEVIKTYRMIGCVPTDVGDAMELSWDPNNNAQEYRATWEYDYWESDDTTRGSTKGGGSILF